MTMIKSVSFLNEVALSSWVQPSHLVIITYNEPSEAECGLSYNQYVSESFKKKINKENYILNKAYQIRNSNSSQAISVNLWEI